MKLLDCEHCNLKHCKHCRERAQLYIENIVARSKLPCHVEREGDTDYYKIVYNDTGALLNRLLVIYDADADEMLVYGAREDREVKQNG